MTDDIERPDMEPVDLPEDEPVADPDAGAAEGHVEDDD